MPLTFFDKKIIALKSKEGILSGWTTSGSINLMTELNNLQHFIFCR